MPRTAKLNRLSAVAVRQYIKDDSATTPLHDGGGLYLRKRDAGAYWYLRLSEPSTGAQQWHRLFADVPNGGFPDKGLADARQRAAELWAQRERGLDPRAEAARQIAERARADEASRAAEARRLTIRKLFDQWVETALAPQRLANGTRVGRKDGGAEVRARFNLHVFDDIGDMAAEDVGKRELLALLDRLRTKGKLRSANLLLQELRQMFSFALKRDIVTRNPLDTVSKADAGGASVERDRVLSATELQQLADALPTCGMNSRAIAGVLIILATGCRLGELLGASFTVTKPGRQQLMEAAESAKVKFGTVDTVAQTWHLPSTKNQRSHTIHLSTFACRQFDKLAGWREADGDGNVSAWAFPARDAKFPLGASSFAKPLADRQVKGRQAWAGRTAASSSLVMPGGRWTAHDLRRTAATLMAQLGISADVIDECLNHQITSGVRRIYIRDRREADQAKAFDALGARLATIFDRQPAIQNVVAFKTAA